VGAEIDFRSGFGLLVLVYWFCSSCRIFLISSVSSGVGCSVPSSIHLFKGKKATVRYEKGFLRRKRAYYWIINNAARAIGIKERKV